MKKILSFLLVTILAIGVVGCSGKKETTQTNQTNQTNQTKTESKKALGVGEEYIFKKDGKDYYSIKINGVKIANDFKYIDGFTESNRKQIVEVDYTYRNISKEDDKNLEIGSSDLKVMDSTGAMAQNSYMFPKQKPQAAPVGANCTVQAYYGLANKSDKVRINFTSQTLGKTAEFEIPVN